MVFSGFWLFDMSDEVREHYLPRPGECPSQLHDNISTQRTLQRDNKLSELFRLFRFCKFFWLPSIVVVFCQ